MTVESWASLVGIFLPAVVAFINRVDWKSWLKAVVALGSSIVAGTVTALLSGDFTGANWMKAIGLVFAASQLAYMTWWKGSGISEWIEKTINAGKSVVGKHELSSDDE